MFCLRVFLGVSVNQLLPSSFCPRPPGSADDDDVGLHVLGCRVDILGTNCKKVLKVMMGGGGRVALASVRIIVSGGQQGAYCWIQNTFCRWGYILLRIKNDDHLLTAVDGQHTLKIVNPSSFR